MNIVGHIEARSMFLPPIEAMGYEYVLAGNGVFIRAEDSRIEAMVRVRNNDIIDAELAREITPGRLHELRPRFTLKLPRVPSGFLPAVLTRARKLMPNEFCCQFTHALGWRCLVPPQRVGRMAVEFQDTGDAVIDLHSHNSMNPFWSATDNADEQGLRVYVVVGNIDTNRPRALARVGVYGHHMPIPLSAVFEGQIPFTEATSSRNPSSPQRRR